jgi:hypothetical protein
MTLLLGVRLSPSSRCNYYTKCFWQDVLLHLLAALLHSLLEDEMLSSEAIARRILELMVCDLQESKALPSVS